MIQEKDCEIKAKVLKKIFQVQQGFERYLQQQYFISLAKKRWQSPIYSEIKSAFNIKSTENKILGRENQIQAIKNFLQSIVTYRNTRKSQLSEQKFQKKVLIIEGLRNTGKTYFVKKSIKQVKQKLNGKQNRVKFIEINSSKLLSPQEIYIKLIYQIQKIQQTIKFKDKKKKYKELLDDYFQGKGNEANKKVKKVFIIDSVNEMNYFTQEIYQNILFRWPLIKNSNFFVIFISNELDVQKKLPSEYLEKVMQNKLTFANFDQQKITDIVKQKLKKFPQIISKQVIQFIVQQFTQKQKNLEECFSIVCRMILRRQWQIRNQVYNKVSKRNFSIEDHQSFTKYQTIIKGTQPFSKQQVLNAIHQQIKYSQEKNKDNLVDDFMNFPKSYKVVLICMFNFFRIRPSQYPRMKFVNLYQVLKKNHIRGQKKLWQILYDMRSLGLIGIMYENTKQLALKKRQIIGVGLKKLQKIRFQQDTIDLKIRIPDFLKISKIFQEGSAVEFRFDFDCLRNLKEEQIVDSQDGFEKYQQDSQQEKEDQSLQDKIFRNPIKIEEQDQLNL